MESKILENGNLEITIKYVFRGLSGKKRIISPGVQIRDSEPLIKHIARAIRWQKFIDDGKFQNAVEMAHALGIDPGMVQRTLRLAMLSPEIIHRIIMGDIPSALNLASLRNAIPDLWDEQQKVFLQE